MSRCFPFPPPGYEKKARIDHVDLLAKEKLKEKKHKKEKREKEKREGKERKDKDRSKDKKDRKEKQKDKKKESREKGKNKTSDGSKIEERTAGHNEEKLGESSWKVVEDVKDSRFADELRSRIKEEEKGAANLMVKNSNGSVQRSMEGICSATAVKEKGTGNKMVPNLTERGSGDKMVPNLTERGSGNKMVPNLTERGSGNKMVPNLISEQRRSNGMGQPVEKGFDKTIERKEKSKDREADDRRGDRHRDRDPEKRNKGKDKDRVKEKEKEKVKMEEEGERKHKQHDKPRDSGKKDQVDNLNTKPLAPHKENEKSGGIDARSKKRKDIVINGFLHENDVRPIKFPRLASSTHLPVENGKISDATHIATPFASTRHGAINNITAERILDKKEHTINGIVNAQPSSINLRPSVVADTSENGEASTKPPHPDCKYLSKILSIPKVGEENGEASVKPPHPDCKYLSKILSIPKVGEENGEASVKPPHPDCKHLSKILSIPKVGEENGEASAKPPHPDCKYLSKILSIPKVDECLESDNQEWLLSSSDNLRPKPKTEFKADEAPQVWAETLMIDADTFALPYVIPY